MISVDVRADGISISACIFNFYIRISEIYKYCKLFMHATVEQNLIIINYRIKAKSVPISRIVFGLSCIR